MDLIHNRFKAALRRGEPQIGLWSTLADPCVVELLAGSGFSLVTAFSTLNSLVQEHAPNALRGRVLSIFGLAFRGGMPVGSLAAGTFVRAYGAPAVIGTFAVVLFVVAAVVRLRSERLRAL